LQVLSAIAIIWASWIRERQDFSDIFEFEVSQVRVINPRKLQKLLLFDFLRIYDVVVGKYFFAFWYNSIEINDWWTNLLKTIK
jgi:hypothetical protein